MRVPGGPLEKAFRARVDLLATTLSPHTVRCYGHTVGLFMAYLREHFPDIRLAITLPTGEVIYFKPKISTLPFGHRMSWRLLGQ